MACYLVKKYSNGLLQLTMNLPVIYEMCKGLREPISSMFSIGTWLYAIDEQEACNAPDCTQQRFLGIQRYQEHALNVLGMSALSSPIRKTVEQSMNRKTDSNIRTPHEATAWFADSNTTLASISERQVRILTRFRDGHGVFAADTESVGPLLIQTAVIDASRNALFSGFINNGCATVEDLWQLATRFCGGRLTKSQSCALRKAFESPSSNAPRSHSMKWLAEH
ncbi:Fc.00g022000.m01.CDS01 [Cosmosporella sp. VM-42]